MASRAPSAYTRLVTAADAEALRAIYNVEVTDSTVTMDLVPRTLGQQIQWIDDHSGVFPAIVAVDSDPTGLERILGFASVSPYRSRPGYTGTVEDSVYVHRDHQHRGLGRQLLEDIVQRAATSGFHVCIAHVADGHAASIRLHESVGFTMVGIEREVARKFNRWIDICIMQKPL